MDDHPKAEVGDGATLRNVHLYGDWSSRRPELGVEPGSAGHEAIEWYEGKRDSLSPEALECARGWMQKLDRHRELLERGLRQASVNLRELAAGDVEEMNIPQTLAESVRSQRAAARYEVALHAAQLIVDVINDAWAET